MCDRKCPIPVSSRLFHLAYGAALIAFFAAVANAEPELTVSLAMAVRYATQSGKFYQLQVKRDGNWTNVGVAKHGTGQPCEELYPAGEYRVIPPSNGGEIDIVESRGSAVHETTGAIHFGGPWPRIFRIATRSRTKMRPSRFICTLSSGLLTR